MSVSVRNLLPALVDVMAVGEDSIVPAHDFVSTSRKILPKSRGYCTLLSLPSRARFVRREPNKRVEAFSTWVSIFLVMGLRV